MPEKRNTILPPLKGIEVKYPNPKIQFLDKSVTQKLSDSVQKELFSFLSFWVTVLWCYRYHLNFSSYSHSLV